MGPQTLNLTEGNCIRAGRSKLHQTHLLAETQTNCARVELDGFMQNHVVIPDTPTCRVEDAARVYGISRDLAYQLARAGTLPGVIRLGHRYVVSTEALRKTLSVGTDGRDDAA